MKLNKEDGIRFLREFKMPTIEPLDIDKVISGEQEIERGLSVRLSQQRLIEGRNVYLPSIHDCTDVNQIRTFVGQYKGKYKILIHETVHPELIGAISKLEDRCSIVIETYDNFENRKKEIISNRVIIPLYGDKMMLSKMEIQKKDERDYEIFKKVIRLIRDVPFLSYDIDFNKDERKQEGEQK